MNVYIRTNFSNKIGLGHLTRSKRLAIEMEKKGINCIFFLDNYVKNTFRIWYILDFQLALCFSKNMYLSFICFCIIKHNRKTNYRIFKSGGRFKCRIYGSRATNECGTPNQLLHLHRPYPTNDNFIYFQFVSMRRIISDNFL